MNERRILLTSTLACLLIGCVGVVAALMSDSQAILLDGLFNITYFAAGLFTLRVAALVQRGDDERFPFGYSFFEPLVNGLKGVLVLGISALALIDAIDALFSGGRSIAAGTAISYGVFASAACWLMALVTHRGARRGNGPLVEADAKNWLVNAAISSAVLLAFLTILVIQDGPLSGLVPFVDPALVVIVVLISISVPIRMAGEAIMQLLNRAPHPQVGAAVDTLIRAELAGLPFDELFVRVLQPGRIRMVTVHVVLPSDYPVVDLATFDALRQRSQDALQRLHTATVLDMIFTADRIWGAPLGDLREAFKPAPKQA